MKHIKDVLVIGGTRYFGRSIVEGLLAKGHRVTVFTRGNRRPDLLRNVTHIVGDRHDYPSFRKMLQGKDFDAVIDNIGYRPEEVETTLDILKGHVGLYIFTSTICIYRDQYLNGKMLREADFHPATDLGPAKDGMDEYAIGKIQCESKVIEQKDQPYVILRPSVVVGPDDHALTLYFFLQRILDGGPIVLPKHSKQNLRHVYKKDLARIYPRLLDRTSCWNEAFNVAGKEVLTAEEYLGFMADYVEKDLHIAYVPQVELDAVGYVQPFVLNRINDISRLENKVEVEMTSFRTWMATSVEWYLTEYTGPDSKGYGTRQQEIDLAKRYA